VLIPVHFSHTLSCTTLVYTVSYKIQKYKVAVKIYLVLLVKFIWLTGNHPFLFCCRKTECIRMVRPLDLSRVTPADQLLQSANIR